MNTSLVLAADPIADSRDRPKWLAARTGKIGASDAAKYAKVESAPLYLRAKLDEAFQGNTYTSHGNDRERAMLAAYRIEQNTMMFASRSNPRHVATPDGILIANEREVVLAQAKTTLRKTKTLAGGEVVVVPPFTNAKGERVIPPDYKRQMWWEQYVLGASRTLFVFEEHENFRPTSIEPDSMWLIRDDTEIDKLITIANLVLAGMDAAIQFRKEIQS